MRVVQVKVCDALRRTKQQLVPVNVHHQFMNVSNQNQRGPVIGPPAPAGVWLTPQQANMAAVPCEAKQLTAS